MRTSLLLLFLTLLGYAAHAQDLLTRRNGDEVQVKVVEITPNEVKYHRTDNPDGPLISVWRGDVFMIRYANGTKEVFSNGTTNVVPQTPVVTPPSVTAPIGTTPSTGGVVVPGDEIENIQTISLSGPRLGFTVLTGGVIDKARERISDLNPFLTQFGWQFEGRLFRMPNGVSGLAEFIPLVGGLEQGQFIPSVSGLLGVRGAKGFEVGVGPNVTPLGASLVLAVGTSFQSNGVNFPVNLAVVPGHGGVRISLLIGFNTRRR